MDDYPRTLMEFERRFATEKACRAYLIQLRWPEGVRCHRVCKPGDVLSLSIKPKRLKSPLATFEGQIRVGQEKAAIAEEITLTFAFAEEVAEPAPSVQPTVAVASGPAQAAVNA